MKTRSRWFHLRGLFLLSVGLTLGIASAFAGPSTSSDQPSLRQQTTMKKAAQKTTVYYCLTPASGIPKPCAWVNGAFTTTAIPMEVIGRHDASH